MNGGPSQSARVLIDAFGQSSGQTLDTLRHACAAYSRSEMRRRLNHFDDTFLDTLESEEIAAARDAKDALTRAGIDPLILAEVLS